MARELRVIIAGDTSRLGSAYSKASIQTDSFGSKVSNVAGKAMKGLAIGAGIAGVAVAVGMKKSLDAAGDFQSKMKVLGAVTGGTNAQIAAASKLAIKLGADAHLPAVSAADAADAMLELGKAGFTVTQSMKAARGTLLLATAAETDNATAAKVVAQNIQAFGLKARDTSRIVDNMAGVMNTTGLKFDAFADSLSYVGAISKTVGQQFDDTATQLAILSQHGIEGSMAGTGLRTILSDLGNQSSKASGMFAKLGITTVGANGQFIGMRSILQQLHPELDKMTSSQRLAFMQTAFGKFAMNQANIVLGESVKQYDKAKAAIDRKGQADKLAASHMQGYKGAVKQLGSALETLQINMGIKLLPVATRVANFLTHIASAPSISVAIHIALKGIKDLGSSLWKQLSDALTGDTTQHILIGGSSIAFRNDGQGLASKFWQWFVGQIGSTPTAHVVVGGSVISFKRDATLRDQFAGWLGQSLSDAARNINWSHVVQQLAIGLPTFGAKLTQGISKEATIAVEKGIEGISLGNAKIAIVDIGKVLAGATIAWGKLFIAPLRGAFSVIGPQIEHAGEAAAADAERLGGRIANGIKTAPGKLVGLGGDLAAKVSDAVGNAADAAYSSALDIGSRIKSGAINGITGLAGMIKDKAEQEIRSGLSHLNPFSPVEHGGEIYIGKKIVEGAIAGIQNGTPSFRAQIITSIRTAVTDAKANAMSAAGELGNTIASAISARAAAGIAALDTSPLGQQLAALTQQITDRQNAEQLASLQAGLSSAQASGDPAQIQAAQQALDDWTLQQQADTLGAQLQAQKDEIQKEADAKSTAVQTGLTNLQDSLNRGLISQKDYNAGVKKLLGDSGEDYTSIGASLGSSFANGFRDQIKALAGDVSTILSGSSAISWARTITTTGGAIATGGKGFKGFADGGIVKGGRGGILGLIGEGKRDELITPLDSNAGRQALGGGGGGITIENLTITTLKADKDVGNIVIESILAAARTGNRNLKLAL